VKFSRDALIMLLSSFQLT